MRRIELPLATIAIAGIVWALFGCTDEWTGGPLTTSEEMARCSTAYVELYGPCGPESGSSITECYSPACGRPSPTVREHWPIFIYEGGE